MKKWSNIFLLFVSALLTLCAAELVVRLATGGSAKLPSKPAGWAIIPEESWMEYHPTLGWFSRKNRTSKLIKNSLEIPIHTEKSGARGSRDYDLSKPPRIKRITAFGDSFTFGFGVRDDETFPAQLEKKMPGTEVLNFGVPEYGVDQIVLAAQEMAPSYGSDTVLVTLYPEDFWRATRSFNDAGHGKPYFTLASGGKLELHQVPVPEGKHFSVEQFPVVILKNPVQKVLNASRLFSLGERALGRIEKKIGLEDPDTTVEWRLGREILKRLIVFGHEHRLRIIFVLAPPVRWILGTDEPVRQSLAAFSKREKVEFVDLTPVFLEAVKKNAAADFYIPEDQHWTARGNSLAADTLTDYFKKHPL